MLIVEHTSNGTTTVKIKKDWSPSRIGRAYMQQSPYSYVQSAFESRLQAALLDKRKEKQA